MPRRLLAALCLLAAALAAAPDAASADAGLAALARRMTQRFKMTSQMAGPVTPRPKTGPLAKAVNRRTPKRIESVTPAVYANGIEIEAWAGKGAPRLRLKFGPETAGLVAGTVRQRDLGEPEDATLDEPQRGFLANGLQGPGRGKKSGSARLRMGFLEVAATDIVGQEPAWKKVKDPQAGKSVSYPAKYVGKFNTIKKTSETSDDVVTTTTITGDCSGTFISPTTFLTSAHCTMEFGATFAPGALAIQRGQTSPDNLGEAHKVGLFLKPVSFKDAYSTQNLDYGVACVTKKSPGSLDLISRAGDKYVSDGWKFTEKANLPDGKEPTFRVYSYPAKTKGGQTLWVDSSKIARNGDSRDVGLHYCDTESGSSGSGLLMPLVDKVTKNKRVVVAGLHWGACQSKCNMFLNAAEASISLTINSFIQMCDEYVKEEAAKKKKAGQQKK